MKIFISTSLLYVSYMEPFFVVTNIIGSPGNHDGLPFHSKLFKFDNDHYKVLSVTTIITLQSNVAYGNVRIPVTL